MIATLATMPPRKAIPTEANISVATTNPVNRTPHPMRAAKRFDSSSFRATNKAAIAVKKYGKQAETASETTLN